VEKLTGAFFNFLLQMQTKSKFKMVLQEKKKEFSVVIRFTSSSAFKNNEG
jgi:hypothetical protein